VEGIVKKRKKQIKGRQCWEKAQVGIFVGAGQIDQGETQHLKGEKERKEKTRT